MATVDLLGGSRRSIGFGENEEAIITLKDEDDDGGAPGADPTITFGKDEDPDTYMNIFEPIKNKIDEIDSNREDIVKLNTRYHASTTVDGDKAIMKDLDTIMSKNTSLTKDIKKDLDNFKKENDKFARENKGSSVAAWRQNQLNSITRRFKSASVSFQNTLTDFNKNLRNKQTRQIRILDTEHKLKEDDIEELANDPQRADEFIQQQFQMVDVGDEFLDRLADIEQRHEGMKRIEQSIKELHELFTELSILVNEQQERLDSITNNVEQTKDYIKSGVVQLQKAEKHQKCTRKMQMYMCGGCFVLLLIIVIILVVSKS